MNHWLKYRNRPMWAYLPTLALTLIGVYLLRQAFHSNAVAMAGANIWEVADWIAMDGLEILTTKSGVCQMMNNDWQPEYEKDFPIGDTTRVPLPVMGIIRQGMGYTGAPVVNKHTTLTADQFFGMDYDFDSVEDALRMGRSRDWISKKINEPFFTKMATEWDQRGAQFIALNTPNITTGALGTNPGTFDVTTSEARQQIVEYAGWNETESGAFLPPAVMRALRTNNALAFNPVTEQTKAFRTGLFGHADDFDIYEAMTLLTFTSGTWANPSGLTVRTASNSGDTTLDITCTTGDVFKQGDVIQVSGRFRVNPVTKQAVTSRALRLNVTVTTTGAASHASVPVSIGPYGIIGPGDAYQNVDSLPAVNDVVTMWPGTTFTANTAKSGTLALTLNMQASLIAGVKLRKPKAVEKAALQEDPNTGIYIRITETWDPISARFINRLDTGGGFGVGFTDSCAVKIPCA